MVTLNNVHPKFVKTKTYDYFHVFTDGQDYNFDIKKLGKREARKQAFTKKNELVKVGEQNIRIYECAEYEDYRDGNIETDKEVLIFSKGRFPY